MPVRGRPLAARPPHRGRPVGFRQGLGTLPKGRLLSQATEYWLASRYSGSGAWLGVKGVADLAFPGGSADPTWRPHSTSQNPFGAGVEYVALPGTSGNYISTPDTAALDITGDISFVVQLAAADWTPAANSILISKWNTTGNQRAYFFGILTTGEPYIAISSNGSSAVISQATVATGFTNGAAWWLAASMDVNDGSGNRVAKFWTSSDGTSWTQLGTTVTDVGTTTVFNSTAVLEMMSLSSGTTNHTTGSLARGQVYSGVRDFSGTPSGGTLVADFNPAGGTWGATESTLTGTGDSLTWTINRSTSGRRAWLISRDGFDFGTDDYLSTPDNALFDFEASQDFTVATLFRARQDANSAIQSLVTKRDTATSTAGWATNVQGSSSSTEFVGVVEAADAATTISDATWNNPGQLQSHVLTRTAGATGTLDLYTDAVSVGGAAAEPGDTGNALVMSVGRSLTSGSGANFFEGLVHAVAIFRTGLTATQVTQLDAELRALA